MSNLPTIEEHLNKHYKKTGLHFKEFANAKTEIAYDEFCAKNPLPSLHACILEFTKMHVEKALEEAACKAMLIGTPYTNGVENEELSWPVKDSVTVMEGNVEYRYKIAAGPILTAYSPDNIK